MSVGAKQSKQERLARLYRTWGSVIYSRCRRLLRDDALAEDATQDVFLKVLRHLDAAPGEAAALAWIYRISTNHCLSLIRNRGRQAVPSGELPDPGGEHPEARWNDRHLRAQLIERAPEKLRAAAALYFVEGLQHREIALFLGVSRRTVISRLNDFVDRSITFVSRDPSTLRR